MAEELDPALVRSFVLAGHGDHAQVQALLAAHPALLNAGHTWRPGDTETAIQAAAHVGNAPIVRYLLEAGAPLAIPTAAMLGDRAAVEALLAADAARINEAGAHSIPLLTHAVMSGDLALVRDLHARGATTGQSMALTIAADIGDTAMADWLLSATSPDLAWANWQGKTALQIAEERGDQELAARLRAAAS